MAPQTLAKNGFIATDAVLKSLARDYVAGANAAEDVKGTYLRVLVAHSQRETASLARKRVTQADALGAVAAAHGAMYAVILDAVTTPEIAADDSLPAEERQQRARERNRRTTFARTAKSTLTSFIKAGGRLVALEPATVSKEQLRSYSSVAREGPQTVADQVAATESRLEKLIAALKAENPEAAQEAVQSLQMKLQAIVTPPKRMGSRKLKDMTLTAHAAH